MKGGILCVLVVDDLPDAADKLARLLIERGYSVQVAYSSTAAIEQAKLYEADVVLLDLGLPEMDGYELALNLRRLRPSVVLAAVSGHAGAAYEAKARASGIDYYFVKPVAGAMLREVLETIAERIASQGDRKHSACAG